MRRPHPKSTLQRARGRPKGTAKYEQADLALLTKFADLQVAMPGAKLAPFLVPVLASTEYPDKDVRRMQKRWRAERGRLMEEAKLRADAKPAESIADLGAFIVAALSDISAAMAPGLNRIADSFERARARVRARQQLGLDLDLPLRLQDEETVEQACREYEATIGRCKLPAEFDKLELPQLPFSMRLYSAALLLHQYSLQEAAREAQAIIMQASCATANTKDVKR